MEITSCDICGSSRRTPFLNRPDRVSGETFQLVRCNECGLIYLRNRPALESIASYYPEDYECYTQTDGLGSTQESWHHRRAMNMKMGFIEKHAEKPGRLLDIGCGTGDFLVSARERGWQVKGIELVDRAAKIARERRDLDVKTGSIDDLEIPPESYQLVTMWDVLEHLPSPRRALQMIHDLLENNGLLVFSIPNLKSFDRYLFGGSWIGWDVPRHLHLFDAKNIDQLCEISGFRKIEEKTFIGGKGTFHLSLIQRFPESGHIIEAIEPFISTLLWPYRQISYLVNRGPISTFVLVKN